MYQVVKTQDWTIRGPDNQPAKGFLVTVADVVTGDSFNLETPTLDPQAVQDKVRAHLDARRSTQSLTFD